jgi:hypothetical protein
MNDNRGCQEELKVCVLLIVFILLTYLWYMVVIKGGM